MGGDVSVNKNKKALVYYYRFLFRASVLQSLYCYLSKKQKSKKFDSKNVKKCGIIK